ncbi:M23 family metallopeptidase [Candidatus Puniceispirillum sp.]|nr:M23 family metallopeptidase [Candidatus Puniceispirillum sp.]
MPQAIKTHSPLFYKVAVLISAALILTACKVPNLTLNRTTPASLIVAPLRQAVEPVPSTGIVEVRKNDNVFAVAARYQVTPQSIIKTNALEPPFTLRKGQTLEIIPQRMHTVHPGDSVYVISQRYAVSQFQLAQLNNLSPPFELELGKLLYLPNTLDFSVLDGGLPNEVKSTNVVQPVSTSLKTNDTLASYKRFVAPALNASNGFTWPVKGEIITDFGPSQRGVHNDGVKIAAEEGLVVTAAANGRVAFVGTNIKSFGKLVLLKHDGGIITAYAHLGEITVKEGQIVNAGQAIGTIGKSGRVETPQLHFEIRKSRQPVDPRRHIS